MLSKRRCPYTGVINYYADDDLVLPVGSILKVAKGRFTWRFHVGDGEAGILPTRRAAEAALRCALAEPLVIKSEEPKATGNVLAEPACCH